MVDKISKRPIINGYGQLIAEEEPSTREVREKLNEIIEYINKFERYWEDTDDCR